MESVPSSADGDVCAAVNSDSMALDANGNDRVLLAAVFELQVAFYGRF